MQIPLKGVVLKLGLTADYLTDQAAEKGIYQNRMYEIMENGTIDELQDVLASLFASIPYNNYVNNTISSYEGYYASVIYAYLASLGLDITAEDVTNTGRIDLTVRLEDNIYIMEFKVDGKGSAMDQIREKNYQQKYLAEARQKNKNIFLLGIDFSADKKNISEFAWEKVES